MKSRLLTPILLAVSVLAFGACTHVREATSDAVAWVRDALQTTVDAPLGALPEALGVERFEAPTDGLDDGPPEGLVDAPVEAPARMPSRLASRRAPATHSSSLTRST